MPDDLTNDFKKLFNWISEIKCGSWFNPYNTSLKSNIHISVLDIT